VRRMARRDEVRMREFRSWRKRLSAMGKMSSVGREVNDIFGGEGMGDLFSCIVVGGVAVSQGGRGLWQCRIPGDFVLAALLTLFSS